MDEPDVYELLSVGRDLMRRGKNYEAALVLERAVAVEPSKTSIREALARALYNSGQTRRAGEEFEQAMNLDPADDYAHFGLGLCRARLGDKTRAVGLLKIAIAMRPDSEDYIHALNRLAG
ncbi:MAG: tetratricopeptide repeat protein [Actinomycetota bacterium]